MFILEFTCGCKVEQKECIKVKNALCCPEHKTRERIGIVFVCNRCGKELHTTTKGAPIVYISHREYCDDCSKEVKKAAFLKAVQNGDFVPKERSNRQREKIDYMKYPRKSDCKYYDYCLKKSGIGTKDLDCRGCIRYEFKALDVNDYVSYHGGIDKTKMNKYIDAAYIGKLSNTIEKMLKRKTGKAKFNRLFQSRNKTHEQFILEAQKRSEKLKAESRGKGKAKAK